MNSKIKMLDCTLRDGAYIVDSKFGEAAIKGIISKLQMAGVEIIECGWLKNDKHILGSTFYHVPSDVIQYINEKSSDSIYTVMIDWDRYDIDSLPLYDGKSIDAIRVVFPHEKYKEGIEVGRKIKEKGYKIFFQAANTLAYSTDDLKDLAEKINKVSPEGISVVDTFGAMYEEDLERIVNILDKYVDKEIGLGFHSHNNQQMAFANSMHFVNILNKTGRNLLLDASLCGMGRGAGNATTELIANFLNVKYFHNYDLDAVMDAIDIYMTGFQEKYVWGYTTPYFIAGMYCCHVNNIAYLQNNHRTNSRDMRNIIESLSSEERIKYDYDLLERKFVENQDRQIDDRDAIASIRGKMGIKNGDSKKIVLIAPGKESIIQKRKVLEYINTKDSIVVAVNAILPDYNYDYLFVTNTARYEYAKITYPDHFAKTDKILLSNIKKESDNREYILNYSRAIKRGWPHFDNAVICALRLMDRLCVKDVYIAGFDGFKNKYNESYADESLPTLNSEGKWEELNDEIKEMFNDVKNTTRLKIHFITDSIFNE